MSENAPYENKTQWFFFGGFLRIVDTSSTTIITGFQKAGRCLLKLSKVSCSTLELQKYERHSAITTATQKQRLNELRCFLCHSLSLFRKALTGCPKLKKINLTSCRGVPRGLKQWHDESKLRNLITALGEMES